MMDHPHNRLLLAEEQKVEGIKNPHHNDVLCGRGVTTNRHPGNESFRSLVGLNKEVYVSSTKRQKMSISRSIVEAVRTLDPPGRFLEKNPDTGLWSEIGHQRAVEKTSQALRDGAANLRKQLSADFGDPEFFNAVFDLETTVSEPVSNSRQKGGNKGKGMEKGKDTGKENKSRISEKAKLPKPKKPTVAKRRHSNPCTGTTSSAKYSRRETFSDSPGSPLPRSSDKDPHLPPSPYSTPHRQSTSHPKSPMTWGGVVSYGESHSSASDSRMNHHSPYDQRSPRSYYSYDRQPEHRHYSKNPQYEYPHTPTEPWYESHHQPWDSYASKYQHYSYPTHSKSKLPDSLPSPSPEVPRHSSSPQPSLSSLPSGPLPPGRHQFSPAGYRTKPHPPDWSPRMLQRRHKYHHSVRHYSPHPGRHRSNPPAHWTPSPSTRSTGSYVLGYGNSSPQATNDTGLSVPSLGEGSHSQRPRIILAPRSRTLFGEKPSRPQSHVAPDFDPPALSPREKRNHFGKVSQMETDEDVPASHFRTLQPSPVGEEKKMDEKEDTVACPVLSSDEKSGSPKSRPIDVPEVCDSSHLDGDIGERKSNKSPELLKCETYSKKEEEQGFNRTEENPAVEDIVMSPIPFDGEDPSTLMELPENILTLPISPCDPNDDRL